ncbi:hypothetical protein PUN4_600072 [Paraburkholderia unamae]|nr:hypothetical protein PUN4_600072 [Paraburkholderia unamae]
MRHADQTDRAGPALHLFLSALPALTRKLPYVPNFVPIHAASGRRLSAGTARRLRAAPDRMAARARPPRPAVAEHA